MLDCQVSLTRNRSTNYTRIRFLSMLSNMLLLVNLFISVTDVSARFLVIPTQYRELSKHTTRTAWFCGIKTRANIIWFLFHRYPLLNQQKYMQLIGVADTCANFLVIQKHSKTDRASAQYKQIFYNHSTEDSRNKAAARENQKVSNASPSHQNQVHPSVYST